MLTVDVPAASLFFGVIFFILAFFQGALKGLEAYVILLIFVSVLFLFRLYVSTMYYGEDWSMYYGVLNLLVSLVVFRFASHFSLPRIFSVGLIFLPLLIPILFSLSEYYWMYLAGNLVVVCSVYFLQKSNRFSFGLLLISYALLAATMQKYSLIFFLISYIILFRSRPGRFVVFATPFVMILAFFIALEFSDFDSFADFWDRRVTRESYSTSQGQTIFGFSDGYRLQIWSEQLSLLVDVDWLFGVGTSWPSFDGVPNHNFIVTYLMCFGIIGLLLLIWFLYKSFLVEVNMYFRYSFVSLLALSLVGEGFSMPFIVISFFVQAGLLSSLSQNEVV